MTSLTFPNPDRTHIHQEVALDNGMIITRYSVAGTYYGAYDVWEPASRDARGFSTHSTFTFLNDGMYGDITTRALPAEVDAIPVGPERSAAVRAHYDGLEEYADALIRSTFPNDFR